MLTYELSPSDLADIHFAISPAMETTLSMRALRDPGRFPLQLSWVRAVRPLLDRLDWDVLRWLVNDTMGSPDFLTPRPRSPLTDIEDELAIVAAVDRPTFDRQLAAVNGTVPAALAEADGIERVVRAVREYWTTLIAPYWPRMRSILSADIAYRGHVLTQRGIRVMLNDLAPVISYADGLLKVDQVSNPSRREKVGDRGLTLMPTMFGPHAAIPFDVGALPLVGYPPRGQGLLWSTATRPAADRADLRRLVGTPRAAILDLLHQDRTTAELATALGVTPSAVSQHLQLMRRTGLVHGHRLGRHVRYHRSDLGDALLGTSSAVPISTQAEPDTSGPSDS